MSTLLDAFYRHHLVGEQVMLMPYYIASLNIEHEYYALTKKYEPFDGICLVDTLDMAEGAQMKLAFMTEKNSARVEQPNGPPILTIGPGFLGTTPKGMTIKAGDTFNSAFINPGQSFSLTFADAGVYHYNCHIHPGMTGMIVVEPSA